MVDRHLWIEVGEYLIAVAAVVLIVWWLSGAFSTPLWGQLTSIHLR